MFPAVLAGFFLIREVAHLHVIGQTIEAAAHPARSAPRHREVLGMKNEPAVEDAPAQDAGLSHSVRPVACMLFMLVRIVLAILVVPILKELVALTTVIP